MGLGKSIQKKWDKIRGKSDHAPVVQHVETPCERVFRLHIEETVMRVDKEPNTEKFNAAVGVAENSGLTQGLEALYVKLPNTKDLDSFNNKFSLNIETFAENFNQQEMKNLKLALMSDDKAALLAFDFYEWNEQEGKIVKVKDRQSAKLEAMENLVLTDEERAKMYADKKTAGKTLRDVNNADNSSLDSVNTRVRAKLAEYIENSTKLRANLNANLSEEIVDGQLTERGEQILSEYFDMISINLKDINRTIQEIIYNPDLSAGEKKDLIERLYLVSKSLSHKQIVIDELKKGGLTPEQADQILMSDESYDKMAKEAISEGDVENFFKQADKTPERTTLLNEINDGIEEFKHNSDFGKEALAVASKNWENSIKSSNIDNYIIENISRNNNDVPVGELKAILVAQFGAETADLIMREILESQPIGDGGLYTHTVDLRELIKDGYTGGVTGAKVRDRPHVLKGLVDVNYINDMISEKEKINESTKKLEQLMQEYQKDMEENAAIGRGKENAQEILKIKNKIMSSIVSLKKAKELYADQFERHFDLHMGGTAGVSDSTLRNFVETSAGRAASRFMGQNFKLRDNLDSYTRRHITSSAIEHERQEFYREQVARLQKMYDLDPEETRNLMENISSIKNMSAIASEELNSKYGGRIELQRQLGSFHDSNLSRIRAEKKSREAALEEVYKKTFTLRENMIKNAKSDQEITNIIQSMRAQYGEEYVRVFKNKEYLRFMSYVADKKYFTKQFADKVTKIEEPYRADVSRLLTETKTKFISDEDMIVLSKINTNVGKAIDEESELDQSIFENATDNQAWLASNKKRTKDFEDAAEADADRIVGNKYLKDEEEAEARQDQKNKEFRKRQENPNYKPGNEQEPSSEDIHGKPVSEHLGAQKVKVLNKPQTATTGTEANSFEANPGQVANTGDSTAQPTQVTPGSEGNQFG